MLQSTEFQEKVSKIASILGFQAVNNSDKYKTRAILKKDNMELGLRAGGFQNENRISISGHFPKDNNGHVVVPYTSRYGEGVKNSITVSDAKSAEQIAKEIEKRLFPTYLAEIEKAQKIIDSTNSTEDKAKSDVEKLLANIQGSSFYNNGRKEHYNGKVYLKNGSVRILSDGHELQISNVSTDEIIAIMKLINRA